jgi:hypothetical protein
MSVAERIHRTIMQIYLCLDRQRECVDTYISHIDLCIIMLCIYIVRHETRYAKEKVDHKCIYAELSL